MTHHLDQLEFYELINDNDWKALWSAYQYAVDGDEITRVEALQNEIADLKMRLGELSRWVVIDRKSNSGKTLFVCTSCGRVSQTPDKTCKTFEDLSEELF